MAPFNMKSFNSKSIAFILALIILVSSNGVVLAVHTCLSKAATEVSLFGNKGCCSENKSCRDKGERSVVSAKCCNISFSFHKTDVSSVPQKSSFTPGNFSFPAYAIQDLFTLRFSSAFSIASLKAPPGISGKGLLRIISIFRI